VVRTKLTLAYTALIFLSLLSWQCTKIDTTSLGGGLIPAVDNVNTFDTILNVVANNFDSIPSGKGCVTIYPTDDHVLGYIGNDPYFGTTLATIYTELKPAIFPFYFDAKPSDRTLDSVVLVLSYKRTFGDSSLAQNVVVHEISKSFNPDSSTCTSYLYNFSSLGSASYVPKKLGTDSVKTKDGDTSINQLRIKLSTAFGQSLLAQDTIKTDTLFMNFFKGFAIVPNNTGNALSYFGITDAATKLVVYYKYKRTNLPDTTGFKKFGLFNGDRSANNISRDRSTAEIKNFSNGNSNPAGDNFIYIQSSPGSYTELKIPGLTGLSNRIVHRAELIIDQAYSPLSINQYFTPPSFLFLDIKDTGKNYLPIPCDFNASTGSPDLLSFGGLRTTAKDENSNSIARYTFIISRFVQKIVTNKRTNSILRLSAPHYVSTPVSYIDDCLQFVPPLFFPLNNIAFGSVKFVGGTTTSTLVNRIRLRIIFSKI
jgi:hypothetical protein